MSDLFGLVVSGAANIQAVRTAQGSSATNNVFNKGRIKRECGERRAEGREKKRRPHHLGKVLLKKPVWKPSRFVFVFAN